MTVDEQYNRLVKHVIENGSDRQTRNSMCRTLFCPPRIVVDDVMDEFPILTSKYVPYRLVFEELMWFIRGETNSKVLEDKGVCIWKANTSRQFLDKTHLGHLDEGDTGPLYGFTMRHSGAVYRGCNEDYTSEGVDQLYNCIKLIKDNPFSRRICLTMWQPLYTGHACLEPCHGTVIQFFVSTDSGCKYLDMFTHQRSADIALGLPFNLASYATFLILVASVTGCTARRMVYSIGDAHIYDGHGDALLEQVENQEVASTGSKPRLVLKRGRDLIEEYTFDDVLLENYKHLGKRRFRFFE